MTTEAARQQEEATASQKHEELCPMCNLHTGRRIRGKVYCVNCGYIES